MVAPLIWSTTPSDNQTIDAAAQFPEGQPASSLNNGTRGMMARLAMARDDAAGTIVATVSASNVFSITTKQSLIDPASTQGGGTAKISKPFLIRAVLPALTVAVATTAPTIAIDGAAAVPLVRRDGSALADGDLTGVPVEILGDTVAAGAITRVRILALLPSDLKAILGDASGYPVGGILPFSGGNLPTGFLLANGAILNRADYPKLWAQAQISGMITNEATWTGNFGYQSWYSSGDNAGTFRIPALNGLFLRGLDNGRGLDPSRQIGTTQGDAIRSHGHGLTGGGLVIQLYGVGPPVGIAGSGGDFSGGFHAVNIANTGDNETRPVNAAYPFLIRAY